MQGLARCFQSGKECHAAMDKVIHPLPSGIYLDHFGSIGIQAQGYTILQRETFASVCALHVCFPILINLWCCDELLDLCAEIWQKTAASDC